MHVPKLIYLVKQFLLHTILAVLHILNVFQPDKKSAKFICTILQERCIYVCPNLTSDTDNVIGFFMGNDVSCQDSLFVFDSN